MNKSEIGYDAYSRYKNANIESIRALQNDALNVRIIVPTGNGADRKLITIPCFMAGDITINGLGNEWGALLNTELLSPIVNGLQDSLNLLNTFMKSDGSGDDYTGSAQVLLKSRHMSAASWHGSKLPVFSVPLVFVSLDPQVNPLDTFLALARAVLPNSIEENGGQNQSKFFNISTGVATKIADGTADLFAKAISWVSEDVGNDVKARFDKMKENGSSFGTQMIKGGMLEAPLGYGLTMQGEDGFMTPNKNSTLNLRIGKWLNAYNLLVDSLGTPTFSRQTMQGTGLPLYIKCNITLRPYKMITYKEFLEWFPQKRRSEAY